MSGLRLAALYGLKPYQLGFCGPQNNGELLRYLKKGNAPKKKIREILEQFKGAYPYYKLIAKRNNIKDPFDERVVKAYWVGNELLEKAGGFKSHHSYHVLVKGSVTGRIVLKGKLLDLCRVGWGKVKSMPRTETKFLVRGQKLKVKCQPLIGKKKLKLGEPIEKEIDWDKSLVPNVKIGDLVSFHWNQVAEVLSDKDVRNFEKYKKITLDFL